MAVSVFPVVNTGNSSMALKATLTTSQTWTAPAGITSVYIVAYGAGGGGGGGAGGGCNNGVNTPQPGGLGGTGGVGGSIFASTAGATNGQTAVSGTATGGTASHGGAGGQGGAGGVVYGWVPLPGGSSLTISLGTAGTGGASGIGVPGGNTLTSASNGGTGTNATTSYVYVPGLQGGIANNMGTNPSGQTGGLGKNVVNGTDYGSGGNGGNGGSGGSSGSAGVAGSNGAPAVVYIYYQDMEII